MCPVGCAQAKALLKKCTDNTVCAATLSTLVKGATAAVAAVEDKKGDMETVFAEAMAAGKAGVDAAKGAADAMSMADKVWADVVEVASSGGAGAIVIEEARFVAALHARGKYQRCTTLSERAFSLCPVSFTPRVRPAR